MSERMDGTREREPEEVEPTEEGEEEPSDTAVGEAESSQSGEEEKKEKEFEFSKWFNSQSPRHQQLFLRLLQQQELRL